MRTIPLRRFLLFTLLGLTAGLACQTVTGIVTGEVDSIEPRPPSPTAPSSQAVPDENLQSQDSFCPETTANILEAATEFYEGDPDGQSQDEPEETYLVTYSISGDQIGDPIFEEISSDLEEAQRDQSRHAEIWRRFTALIPADERSELAEFSIVTDGEGNLLAAVGQTFYDPNLWVLEIDISDTDDHFNLTYTLIHEYAHLLTLGPAQVPPSSAVFNYPDDEDIYLQEVSACAEYFPGEGCALPESYINAFYDRFWGDIYEEWQDVNLIEEDQAYYEALDDFYYAYEDRFVTDYAATNPEEDIAEAFAFFILLPRPQGDTISEQKVLFFYEYPELVQLRGQILRGICQINQ